MSRRRAAWPIVLIAMMSIAPLSTMASVSDGGADPVKAQIDQVRVWFEQLSHNDPDVREQARTNLMGLRREDLGVLRTIVEQSRPIMPAQEAALHDVVVHVYLAGELRQLPASSLQEHLDLRGQADPEPPGFLGVLLDDVSKEIAAAPRGDGDGAPQQEQAGTLVQDCVPGFCGYRFLRSGDVVLGIASDQFVPTPRQTDLRTTVESIHAGNMATLTVLRQGKLMTISFKLDARPQITGLRMMIEEFRNTRREKAEYYWSVAFAMLLDRGWS